MSHQNVRMSAYGGTEESLLPTPERARMGCADPLRERWLVHPNQRPRVNKKRSGCGEFVAYFIAGNFMMPYPSVWQMLIIALFSIPKVIPGNGRRNIGYRTAYLKECDESSIMRTSA